MKLSFRRLMVLVVTFATAFVLVTVIRTWHSGGDLRALIPWRAEKSAELHPERFTFPDRAPLAIGQVELLWRLNDECARLTEAVVRRFRSLR